MNQEFLSVQNFQMCNDIFLKYMNDEYEVRISNDQELKKNIYECMQGVKATMTANSPLKSLNNAVLNDMRDNYLAKYNISSGSNKKPKIRNLERDNQIFGGRQVNLGEQVKFEMNPPRRDDPHLSKSMESIQSDRDSALDPKNLAKNTKLPFEVIKVSEAPSENELAIRLKDIERERGDLNARFAASVDIVKTQQIGGDEPKSMYLSSVTTATSVKSEPIIDLSPYKNYAQESIVQSGDISTFENTKYILINGYDRAWFNNPYRYSFSVDVNETTRSIRNITEIAFTRLIIPMEVLQNKKTTNGGTDSRFYNQYGMTYPYLMLQVDELSPGVYDGYNETSQKCMTPFMFDREYRASNGRGFIILERLQKEKKTFRGTLLSALPKMTMRIVKPNGTLYNMAKDENSINYLLYETINPLLVRLTCKDFFDVNEFAVGDVVIIKDFKLMTLQEFSAKCETAGTIATQSDKDAYAVGINAFERFMNRDEGHEIMNTGDQNQSSFMNNFSIFLPRKLDKQLGSMVLQKDVFDMITACQKYLNTIPHTLSGCILNMTLQVVLTVKVKTRNGDVSQVMQSQII
jgi:hypothetical protein